MAQPVRHSIISIVMKDLESAESPTAAAEELAPAEVRAAVQRLCHSESLSGSEKLVHFLDFVVETTLSGDARHLKETVVGVSVFGRPPDYDPKADTIVRSQAWRLRSKLTQYYHAEGAQDPVIIDLPRGSYVPVFSRRRPSG